jgi:hypothetical protein
VFWRGGFFVGPRRARLLIENQAALFDIDRMTAQAPSIWLLANRRTIDRSIDRIIFAEAGFGQQESPVAPTIRLTIEQFLWQMVR